MKMLLGCLRQRCPRLAAVSSLVLLFVAVWCAPSALVADERRLYVVGPSDALAITVYNQPQLSGKYVVEADNSFTFPLLGRVKAGGLSLPAIEEELRSRLARGYLKDPQVSVAIDQYRSQQVFMMGEVRTPGSLPLAGPMTLIEALARAGSVTDRAGAEALIVRPRDGEAADVATMEAGKSAEGAEVIRVDLQGLQRGALSQNVALRPGDTVFVPRAASVFVTGRVKSPGEYLLRQPTTVRQALALAGGETDRGSTRRIQILRQIDGREVTLDANLQDSVQAGDTIVVRERLL
jgi:polysaccharide export outer membrane protein